MSYYYPTGQQPPYNPTSTGYVPYPTQTYAPANTYVPPGQVIVQETRTTMAPRPMPPPPQQTIIIKEEHHHRRPGIGGALIAAATGMTVGHVVHDITHHGGHHGHHDHHHHGHHGHHGGHHWGGGHHGGHHHH